MRRYSPCRPTREHIKAGRCVCGYSRKLDAYVSNGCKQHPDVPTLAQVRATRRDTGIWDERNKCWMQPSGTVKQVRRPMFQPFQDAESDEPEDGSRWSLRDEGRSDGHGESYGERNA